MKKQKLYLGMTLIMAGLLSACGQQSSDSIRQSQGSGTASEKEALEETLSDPNSPEAHVPVTLLQGEEIIEPMELSTASLTYDEEIGAVFGDGARLSHVLPQVADELPAAALDGSFGLQIPETMRFSCLELYDSDYEQIRRIYPSRDGKGNESPASAASSAQFCTDTLNELSSGSYYVSVSVVETGDYIESEKTNAYTVYEYAFRLDVPEDGGRALDKEAKELCSTVFYLAGNPDYRLTFTPGGRLDRNRLTAYVQKVLPDSGDSVCRRFSIFWDPETTRYSVPEEDSQGVFVSGQQDQLLFLESGAISLTTPDAETSGAYYPETMYFMPEAFVRPLNQTDTMALSESELKLLRNQFYAVYGQSFADTHLSDYFSRQPWYLPNSDAGEISEDDFPALWRRNLEFVRTREASHSEEQASEYRKAYGTLPDMPYRELLTTDSELLVRFSANPKDAEDRGICYLAQGSLSLPVTLKPQEYEAVKKDGKSVEICINEITGETETIQDTDNPDYGDCLLGDTHYFLSYNAMTGLYELWQNSADTLFKPVYEGEIAVLKGAEEEWYGYFDLMKDESGKSVPGAFRPIRYDQAAEDSSDYTDYCGNQPVFDEKGYLKALYIFGD